MNAATEHGHVILESNFHVYTYHTSPAHIATLALFTNTIATLPNLIMAQITRDTILHALSHGVRAQSIVNFLRNNFHPRMQDVPPAVVGAVMDQILLWESERDRVHFQRGVMYDDFKNAEQFDKVCEYASDCGVLIWKNVEKRMLFVQERAHEELLRDFIKSIVV